MTNQAKKKDFDCIAMKREAQEQISEQIKGLTPTQEIEYFRKAVAAGHIKVWWESATKSNADRFDEVS